MSSDLGRAPHRARAVLESSVDEDHVPCLGDACGIWTLEAPSCVRELCDAYERACCVYVYVFFIFTFVLFTCTDARSDPIHENSSDANPIVSRRDAMVDTTCAPPHGTLLVLRTFA